MSAEVWIGLSVTALSALCFLMWHTDGSLDFIVFIVGGLCTIAGLGITAWDAAIFTAYNGLPPLPLELDRKIAASIKAHRFGFALQYSFLLAGSALSYLPKLMEASRRARIKRPD